MPSQAEAAGFVERQQVKQHSGLVEVQKLSQLPQLAGPVDSQKLAEPAETQQLAMPPQRQQQANMVPRQQQQQLSDSWEQQLGSGDETPSAAVAYSEDPDKNEQEAAGDNNTDDNAAVVMQEDEPRTSHPAGVAASFAVCQEDEPRFSLAGAAAAYNIAVSRAQLPGMIPLSGLMNLGNAAQIAKTAVSSSAEAATPCLSTLAVAAVSRNSSRWVLIP
jgi:hypothetical protein